MRERNYEVDFVYQLGKKLFAIEVKFGNKKDYKGVVKFKEFFPHTQGLVINKDNFLEVLNSLV